MNHYHNNYPDGDDGPAVSLYHTRRVHAARRQHLCNGCSEPILIGSSYARSVYVEDGVFHTFRCHFVCPRDLRELEEQIAAEQTYWSTPVQ